MTASALESADEQQLLQAALEHPFEPAEVPLATPTTTRSPPSAPASTPAPAPAPAPPPDSTPSEALPPEDDTWQAAYASQVSEWRAQSASARTKAELARAKWEAVRARETAERQSRGEPPATEPWDGLGDHITTSAAAATEIVSGSLSDSHSHTLTASVASLASLEHVEAHDARDAQADRQPAEQHGKLETGSPSQRWEHLSSSPASSYPSMSFPEASVPQSPSHQHGSLVPSSVPAQAETRPDPKAEHDLPTSVLPSTLPSILDDRVAPRTRLSLILSSLAINLLLPFINGVMLGFGEIFAKDVLVGWLGWKTRPGRTAAGLGLRR